MFLKKRTQSAELKIRGQSGSKEMGEGAPAVIQQGEMGPCSRRKAAAGKKISGFCIS